MAKPTLRQFRFARFERLAPIVALALLAGPATAHAQVTFEGHLVSATSSASCIVATDIDGDGDVDVLSAASDTDTIVWFENDGGRPPAFTERVISTAADGIISLFATDVDGDGDTDVLVAVGSSADPRIAWYENDGNLPPAFTEVVISTAHNATTLYGSDIDGDGDVDVVSTGRSTIAWFENDGASPPAFTEHQISTSEDHPLSVSAADVDGDGDADVLAAFFAADRIAWYENDGGAPPVFVEREIAQLPHGEEIAAADVDGDEDMDVIASFFGPHQLLWYENDGGSPPVFTERLITVSGSMGGFHASDVDGDGDTDVIVRFGIPNRLTWFENSGSTPPAFKKRIISTGVDGPEAAVDAADVDGDGDTDVLSGFTQGNTTGWWENGGDPLGCDDVIKLDARCTLSGEIRVRAKLNTIRHHGETVTIGVDGTPHVVAIMRSFATYEEPGAGLGPHTVTLEDPPSCFAPIVTQCPAAPQ